MSTDSAIYASLVPPDARASREAIEHGATDAEIGEMSPSSFDTSARARVRCSRLGILAGVALSAVAVVAIAGGSTSLTSGNLVKSIGLSEGGLHWFKMRGAKFGVFNYYIPLQNYARHAMGLTLGYKNTYEAATAWYKSMASDENPMIADGPGGNTKMYYAYDTVKAKLEDFGPRIKDGTVEREGELGITVYNNIPWPEAGRFALGYTNPDHAFVRPFIAAMLDGAGNKDAWLSMQYQALFASMDSFSLSDLRKMICKILHKVTLDISVTDDECKDLQDLSDKILIPAALPPKAADSWILRRLLVQPVLDKKAQWLPRYEQAIQAKWPTTFAGTPWSPRQLTLMASAYLDMILQAGGRSVPTVISFMLAYINSGKDSPHYLNINFKDNEPAIQNLMHECMRYYPAVSVVPRWVTSDGGNTWSHELLNLDRALSDPSQFPEPEKFILGRPGLSYGNATKSIAWADFALVNGDNAEPDSHACPGKQLSISMILGFVRAYLAAGPWTPSKTSMSFDQYAPSGFTMTKTSKVEVPKCWWFCGWR